MIHFYPLHLPMCQLGVRNVGYKAIVSEAGIVASFDQNEMIVNWANQQPLAKPVNCQTVMDMMVYGIYSRKLVVNRTEGKFWTGII
ncbi:hypothetical protein [Microcoleus sp. LAD1_D5]